MPNEQEILAPHRKRKLRKFIVEPDRGNFTDTKVHDAFWAVLFGYVVVDHSTAQAVERELLATDKTVGDVLDGWRPESLTPRDEKPDTVFPPEPPGDDPIPCGDCGKVHAEKRCPP